MYQPSKVCYVSVVAVCDSSNIYLSSSQSEFENSCRFADAICCSEDLDGTVFPTSLSLIPPDLATPDTSRGETR